jgi:hypothetical protein
MRACEPERWVGLTTPRERHGEGLDSGPPFADAASATAFQCLPLVPAGAQSDDY